MQGDRQATHKLFSLLSQVDKQEGQEKRQLPLTPRIMTAAPLLCTQ